MTDISLARKREYLQIQQNSAGKTFFASSEVGADYGEGTPVPIPNTAVKLTGADDTWLEATRDNK